MFEEMKDKQDQQSADIKAILERLEAPTQAPETAPSESAKPATPLSVRLGTKDRAELKTLTDKLDQNGERIETLSPQLTTSATNSIARKSCGTPSTLREIGESRR